VGSRHRRVALILILLIAVAPMSAQDPAGRPAWVDRSRHQARFVLVAPNVRLEILDWGGTGDALVFLAGMSFNAHAFDDFAPRFTDRHHVIGITRRGHGASSWPDSGYGLSTLAGDIGTVLDSLGIQRAILAGHSLAGNEITRFASEHPDRVLSLIYIEGAYDLTLLERLGLRQLCPAFARYEAEIVKSFKNPEAFRRTQLRVGADGRAAPYALQGALPQIMGGLSAPDYAAVRAPALGVYYVPERIEEVFRPAEPSQECVLAFQRYLYRGIAAFAEGTQRATVVALQKSQHNLHLASPDELEAAMRRWLSRLTTRGRQ
jgi:pimeloyl-ACP methyl ester carboxylesterase